LFELIWRSCLTQKLQDAIGKNGSGSDTSLCQLVIEYLYNRRYAPLASLFGDIIHRINHFV
jgi:hypothetical protein